MSNYFTNFPLVSYNGVNVRDILKRTNFIESTFSNPYVFLPYTIKDGEKPEDIAYNYYGSVDHTWLVVLANAITDPYHEWPLSENMFAEFIMKKYAAQSGKVGYDVIAWTQNETIYENIKFYRTVSELGRTVLVSPDTFPLVYNAEGVAIGRNILSGYEPYRIYDYERDINDSKREILVADKQYYQQIVKEFKKLIKA